MSVAKSSAGWLPYIGNTAWGATKACGSGVKTAAVGVKNFSADHPVIAGAAGGSILAVTGAPLLLAWFGFGSGGIVAGSAAAGVQSAVYGGATTGLFSTLTSAGAAGLATTTTAAIGGAGAVAGAKVGNSGWFVKAKL